LRAPSRSIAPERARIRSCILSVGPITPVSAKRPRPWAKTCSCGRADSQMDSRRAVR
jgi:hypothetical protein